MPLPAVPCLPGQCPGRHRSADPAGRMVDCCAKSHYDGDGGPPEAAMPCAVRRIALSPCLAKPLNTKLESTMRISLATVLSLALMVCAAQAEQCNILVHFPSTARRSCRNTCRCLTRLSAALKSGKIEIFGHTDLVGSADYNLALSKRRAQAVEDRLLASGVLGEHHQGRRPGQDRPGRADHGPEPGKPSRSGADRRLPRRSLRLQRPDHRPADRPGRSGRRRDHRYRQRRRWWRQLDHDDDHHHDDPFELRSVDPAECLRSGIGFVCGSRHLIVARSCFCGTVMPRSRRRGLATLRYSCTGVFAWHVVSLWSLPLRSSRPPWLTRWPPRR
ncbi:MAG: OmpA family protein [Exiguobacterium profundum]|nr:MAG: OmpA family protein [Exiguobacterium profundum]